MKEFDEQHSKIEYTSGKTIASQICIQSNTTAQEQNTP